MRAPTEKQYRLLAALSPGTIALAPRRTTWDPLLRHGWVEPVRRGDRDDGEKRFLQPLRITPDGLRAAATGMERYGTDDPRAARLRQLDELPQVTRLREKIAKIERERDDATRETRALKARLRRVQMTLEGTIW